jgi:hypothetical protein
MKVSSPNFVKSGLSKKHLISITVDTLKATDRSKFLSIRFNFVVIGKEWPSVKTTILPNIPVETFVLQKLAASTPYLKDEGGRFLLKLDAFLPYYPYSKHLNCDIAVKISTLTQSLKVLHSSMLMFFNSL